MRPLVALAFLLVPCGIACRLALCQERPVAPPQPAVMRSQSTLVLVPALVRTRDGDLVYTLTADDFQLTDDTVEQKLTLEEDSGAQPLALVVVVETGGAGARQVEDFHKLGAMVRGIPGGVPHATAVISYDSRPEVVQQFTRDDDSVKSAMSRLRAGDDGSATLDALALAVQMLRSSPPRYRRAILLLSETLDHGSKTSTADALRDIQDTNTAIYALAFSSSKSEMKHEAPQIFGQIKIGGVPLGPPAPPGPAGGCMSREPDEEVDPENRPSRFVQTWNCLSLLAPPLRVAKMAGMLARNGLRENVPQTVAQITGGEFFAVTGLKNMQRDLETISNHVPNRYLLSFQPQAPAPGIHAVELRLRKHPEFMISARSSYWAEDFRTDAEGGP